MTQNDSDLQKINELLEIMKENDLTEIEIKHGDDKIFLKRSRADSQTVSFLPVSGQAAPSIPAADSANQPISPTPKVDENLVEIKSLIVGTFYSAPSPDSDDYVEIGSHVDSQTVVCIIEAMKVMNEIKAEASGTITEILVTNGQAVEYGQALFRVKPD